MIHELTEEQEKAKRSLERALKKCNKAGLSLYGMGSGLVAYNRELLRQAEEEHGAEGHDAMLALDGGDWVNDGGAYCTSGGW